MDNTFYIKLFDRNIKIEYNPEKFQEQLNTLLTTVTLDNFQIRKVFFENIIEIVIYPNSALNDFICDVIYIKFKLENKTLKNITINWETKILQTYESKDINLAAECIEKIIKNL